MPHDFLPTGKTLPDGRAIRRCACGRQWYGDAQNICGACPLDPNDTAAGTATPPASGCGGCGKAKGPSLLKRAVNLGKAVVKQAAGGFQHVAPEVAAERLRICEACPTKRFRAEKRTCDACGCFVNVKVQWPAEECPDGHWQQSVTPP